MSLLSERLTAALLKAVSTIFTIERKKHNYLKCVLKNNFLTKTAPEIQITTFRIFGKILQYNP
jgi:hypothetical protein